MAQRIKGQEVEVIMVVGGVAQATTTDVRNFDFVFQTEMLKEGYLGEVSDRYDTIYRGIKGKLEFHFENEDIFGIITAIVDKAQRRLPGTQFNVKATLNYPNGQRLRVLISNVEFGEIPVGFSGREAYGQVTLDFAASSAQLIG